MQNQRNRCRWVKVECSAGCGFHGNFSRSQLARGLPLCGICGDRMEPVDRAVAELVMPDELLEQRGEQAAAERARYYSDRNSAIARVHARVKRDTMVDDAAARRSRRWFPEDFKRAGEQLGRSRFASADLPF